MWGNREVGIGGWKEEVGGGKLCLKWMFGESGFEGIGEEGSFGKIKICLR